jgi:hypothetical protein
MKGTAKEWADKAQADFATATRQLQALNSPISMRSVFTPSKALRN